MRPSKFHLPIPGTLALLCAAALHLPGTANAASSLSATVAGYGPNVPSQTATSGSLSQTKTGSGNRGNNSSEVSASFGVLRLYGEAHSTTGSAPTLVFGSANASWRDDFLIGSTTLNGQTGRVTFSLRIDGNLTGSSNEPATQSALAIRRITSTPAKPSATRSSTKRRLSR